MDLTFLSNYTVVVVVGICLVAGYIGKKWIAHGINPEILLEITGKKYEKE